MVFFPVYLLQQDFCKPKQINEDFEPKYLSNFLPTTNSTSRNIRNP